MHLLFPFAKRFIAGERLGQAVAQAARLTADGFRITLDHLGENVTDRAMARAAVEDYMTGLEALHTHRLECNISIKLTQIGLDIDRVLCRDHLQRIVREAARLQGFVRVDMEGSAYTEATLDAVSEAHRTAPNVGVVIQAMLRRSPADVARMIAERIPVRLVKGAYKEPAAIAYQDRRDLEEKFAELLEQLLPSGVYTAVGTHDAALIDRAKTIAKAHGLTPNDFEFQMLLGIRPSLQRALLAEGWRVRIYCPYGAAWLPYVVRRLRERRENCWFVVRNLFRK